MARLIVLRGETVDRKIDLVRLPVTIGRGQKNDVVLDDPMKGVSRDHAEIRLVDDRYVLVDLESENGIWVSGRRVPEVVLGPNIVASIGPFRLMIGDEAALPVASRAATPATTPIAAPPPPIAAKPRTAAPTPARAGGSPAIPRKWLIGGAIAAVVVIAAIAAPFFMFSGPEQVAVVETPDVSGPIADAERQIGQGQCTDALATIDVALQRYPGNAELTGVRRRAEACVPVETTPAPPPLDAVAELQAAKDLIAARDCAAAMARLDVLLTAQPENLEGQELRKQAASACASAAPAPPVPAPPRRQDPVAVEIPAENGGLTPLPNELDRDYQVRVKAMRDRYDEAVAEAAKGPSARVIATYEGILRDTSPRYLDVAARLADTRKSLAGTARQRVKEAQQLEAKDALDEAVVRLKDAKALDPSLSVDADIARLEAAKLSRGDKACQDARAALNYPNGQSRALQNYRLAARFLPASHACAVEAKSYIDGVGR